jgi:hypothetical protein
VGAQHPGRGRIAVLHHVSVAAHLSLVVVRYCVRDGEEEELPRSNRAIHPRFGTSTTISSVPTAALTCSSDRLKVLLRPAPCRITLPPGVLADAGEEVYAACSFRVAAKAGATSAMKRAISSLT